MSAEGMWLSNTGQFTNICFVKILNFNIINITHPINI